MRTTLHTTLHAIATLMLTAVLASAQAPQRPAARPVTFDGEWSGAGGIRLVLRTDPAGVTGTVMEPSSAAPITIERGNVSGRTATFVTSRSVNGESVTVTWTAELNDDDTLAVTHRMDGGAGGRARDGRRGMASRGRGEGGRGPGVGGRAGRGAGRAGPGREGGEARGRAGGEGRGRGEDPRGRAGERGRAGARGGRGAGDLADPFPEILHRVP